MYIPMSVVLLAMFVSVGGCLVRYASYLLNRSPSKRRININFIIIDCFVSAFLGFFIYWFNVDTLLMRESEAMLINCFVGYLGSQILDIASYLLYSKLGIQTKHSPQVIVDDSKRNKK